MEVTPDFFERQLPTPTDVQRLSIPNFEKMSRQELLKINPRMRSREGETGYYTEGSKTWQSVIATGENGYVTRFEFLIDQLKEYQRREESGCQTLPISPSVMVEIENFLLDYVASGKDPKAVLDPLYLFEDNTKDDLDKLLKFMNIPDKLPAERVDRVRGGI